MRSDIFNGDKHDLEPEIDWDCPWLELFPDGVVPLEVQKHDSLEGDDCRLAPKQTDIKIERFWGNAQGWPAVSVMLQAFADCLGGTAKSEELVDRSGEDAFDPNASRRYVFQYIPGKNGWQGEEI